MPSAEREALGLIELIYAAVSDPSQWSRLLQGLAEAAKAHGVLLRQVNPRTAQVCFSETLGYDDRYIQAYRDYYVHLDPYRELLLSKPVGSILATDWDPGTSIQTRLNTEYFNDYDRPQDRIHVLGSTLARSEHQFTYLGLHRGARSHAFTARDRQLLQLTLPHLAQAVRLCGLLAQSRQRQTLAEAALDCLRIAVFLTDAAGRPFHLNRAAEALLSKTRALTVGATGLTLARAADNARLLQMITSAAAVTDGKGTQGGGDLLALAPDGWSALHLWVTPLSRAHLDLPLHVPPTCAAVFASIPGKVSLPWRRVAVHHGLTPAEARLAVALAEGLSLEEAAAKLKVSINTVRSQLQAVFAKTGIRRQAELTAMLLQGVLAQCRT